MSTPSAGPPLAYMQNVCADCADPLLESDRVTSTRCIKCQCQMHRECGMRDPRENDICETCFIGTKEPLRLEERTAVEDAVSEIDGARKALGRALEKGITRKELYDIGGKVEAAGRLVTDASRLGCLDESDPTDDETETPWGASLLTEQPNE